MLNLSAALMGQPPDVAAVIVLDIAARQGVAGRFSIGKHAKREA